MKKSRGTAQPQPAGAALHFSCITPASNKSSREEKGSNAPKKRKEKEEKRNQKN